MKLVFINVKYTGEVKLTEETLQYLQKFKTIGLYTTTQFNPKIQTVIDQLTAVGITSITSQPERTNAPYQVLGCDVYHENLKLAPEAEAILYIGDGKFHPRALVYNEDDSKRYREIITFNPINKELEILTKPLIEKVLAKQIANKKHFLTSEIIGVIVTTKPGQEHFHYTEKLAKAFPEKTFIPFVTDNVSFYDMEQFPYIQTWVNTACPRIGLEDSLNTTHALLNAEDALALAR